MPVAFYGVPSSFTQGDTVVFSYNDPNYPSSAWNMKLSLLPQTNPTAPFVPLPLAAANPDGSFTYTLAPADTAKLAPGRYVASLSAIATTGGARITSWKGYLFIAPDLSVSLAQTDAMKILAALKAGFASLSKGTISSFSGGGQNWTKKNLKELMESIDRWQVIVDSELRELSLSNRGGAKTLVARFC